MDLFTLTVTAPELNSLSTEFVFEKADLIEDLIGLISTPDFIKVSGPSGLVFEPGTNAALLGLIAGLQGLQGIDLLQARSNLKGRNRAEFHEGFWNAHIISN